MKMWKMLVAVFLMLFAFSMMSCSKSNECAKRCDEAVEQAKKSAGGNAAVVKAAEQAREACVKACEQQ